MRPHPACNYDYPAPANAVVAYDKTRAYDPSASPTVEVKCEEDFEWSEGEMLQTMACGAAGWNDSVLQPCVRGGCVNCVNRGLVLFYPYRVKFLRLTV